MTDDIFYWVLNMSITGALTGIIVMLIRLVKKIPRRFSVFLWAAPFLRFVFPFSVNSKFSVMSLFSGNRIRIISADELYMANTVMAAKDYFPIVYKNDIFETVFGVAFIVWAVIAFGLIASFFAVYFTTMRELKTSRKMYDNVYVSDKITSPALYGVFKPRIIVPVSYANKDLTYVVLHENAHIKRHDNFFRVVAVITACIHWFNPLSWLFLKSFLADMELACDESVIKKLDKTKRKEYARALLDSAENKTVFASPFRGTSVRIRIENILSFNKLSFFGAAATIIFLIAIIVALLTNTTPIFYY